MKADTVNAKPLKLVYTHPESLKKTRMHYCPGCGHGIVMGTVINDHDIVIRLHFPD